jgi:uncharacterized protein
MTDQGQDKGRQLLEAAEVGDTAGVAALLDGSDPPDVDTKDWLDNTALMVAAKAGRREVVEVLLDHHADINARGRNDRFTALLMAAAYGRRDVVSLLLDRGADPLTRAIDGDTALTVAALKGHLPVVELLLDRHPDLIDNRNSQGRTALMTAAFYGRRDVVELLLSREAGVGARDKEGARAQDLVQPGHSDIKRLLQQVRGALKLGPLSSTDGV